jgi:transcriptional activator for dhaKLM operon
MSIAFYGLLDKGDLQDLGEIWPRSGLMQPIGYPIQPDALYQIWQTFVNENQIVAPPDLLLDPAVIESWRRCVVRLDAQAAPRLTRLREQSLSVLMRSQENLISVSLPYMEDIYQFIEGSGCAILLTDKTACVLNMVGDVSGMDMVDELNLGPGSYWSEGYLGTNALALTLRLTMPVQVVGPEHYFGSLHHLVTTAAPIHEAKGRIIGTLSIVGPVKTATSHTLALISGAARAINNQLQASLYLEEANLRLTEVNTVLETIEEGVIAWDGESRITLINSSACRMLGLSAPSVLGQPLSFVLPLPTQWQEAVRTHRRLANVETTFEINGRATTTIASLHPIAEGNASPVGYMAIFRSLGQKSQLVESRSSNSSSLTLDDLPTQSPAMQRVLRQAQTAAKGTAAVLLRGEGGVGKTLIARAIHNAGERRDRPFMAINCRAIPHALLSQEFLGYEKTGARNGRPSKFEMTHGGTLFLGQIESLSLEMQAALLHIIETGTVMRIGGNQPIPVDVRIIAASSADLEQAVAEENFIGQLYYRFNIFNIKIPPLRDRLEDIPLLAERFFKRMEEGDDSPVYIDEDVMAVLYRYPWPGNIRELENVLERAGYHSHDGIIRPLDLPEVVRSGRVMVATSPQPQPIISIAEAERKAIVRAGRACQGHMSEMAHYLGISRTTLWRKMKRFRLEADDFKNSQTSYSKSGFPLDD